MTDSPTYAHRAVKGYLLVLIFTVLAGLAGYLFRVILARQLSTVEFGLFFAIFTFYWLLEYFRSWGLASALAKFIPEFLAKNEHLKIDNAFKLVTGFHLVTGILLGIFFFFTAGFFARHYFHNQTAVLAIQVFAVAFVMRGVKDDLRLFFQGFQDMFWYAVIYFLENSFLLLVVLPLLLVTKTALAPVLAYVIVFTLITILSAFVMLRKRNPFKTKFSYSPRLVRQLWSYGFALMLGGLASMVYLYTDTLILTYFRSLSEVGVYGATVTIGMTLTFLTTPLVAVLYPMMSELWAGKKRSLLRENHNRASTYMLAIVLLPALVVFAFPEPILRLLFGEEYVAGAFTLRILILATLFLVLATFQLNTLNATGHAKVARNLGVAVALLNLVANLLFIPSYGMVAAAATTFASYFTLFVASTFTLRSRLGFKTPWLRWLRCTLAGAVGLATLLLAKFVIGGPLWVHVGVPVLFGGLAYAFALFLFHGLTRDDWQFFLTHFPFARRLAFWQNEAF